MKEEIKILGKRFLGLILSPFIAVFILLLLGFVVILIAVDICCIPFVLLHKGIQKLLKYIKGY
jgi:hypothetical protein